MRKHVDNSGPTMKEHENRYFERNKYSDLQISPDRDSGG